MLEDLKQEDFANHLNTKFEIDFGGGAQVEASLIEVSEPVQIGETQAFKLLFLVPPETPVDQRIFNLRHSALGPFEMFLVPVEGTAEGIKYEAVINRSMV